MTIFVGAFQNSDLFTRVSTILVISSIVITAVYILRAAGIMLFGPIKNKEFLSLGDAHWFEKVSIFLLIIAITAIGFFPGWLSNMISESVGVLVERFVVR